MYAKKPLSSPIQTLLSVVESHHISFRSRTDASQLTNKLEAITAGRELHPALKTPIA